MQVLSDEVNDAVSTFDAISNLTAELILLLQTAFKNNKMRDEQKTDFQETENKIVQSTINNETCLLQKNRKRLHSALTANS